MYNVLILEMDARNKLTGFYKQQKANKQKPIKTN
jgi:hypothetical protein